MVYQQRVIDGELAHLLHSLPAIAIEGPKGVGKTASALRHAASFLELDDPAQRSVVEADIAGALTQRGPILIDEWQRLPPVWDAVRRTVDRDTTPGRFLLTGSAAPDDVDTHSGAGRIVRLRMRPMTLAERGLEVPTVSLASLLSGGRDAIDGSSALDLRAYANQIVSSGFPGIRHLTDKALRTQLDGYLARIVDRDFEDQGHRVRRPQVLARWMRAYAAASATCASFETLRDAATGGESEKPGKTSIIAYREVLERLWIVDPLPPWLPSRNRLTTLAKGPKHHLADPALAARLLGVSAEALLGGEAGNAPLGLVSPEGSLLGHLFESLVTLCVRVYAQACESQVAHCRTQRGRHEVDLIVARGDGKIVALEVKLGNVVDDDDVRHLRWLADEIGDTLLDAVIVTTGKEAYRRRDGIAVVPAALLGP